ncbi:MAG: heavy metal transporter [Pseudobutyrivibrio ruminis]|nr:heavy metal transporter [Pseudobutyrivibrio ruminis]
MSNQKSVNLVIGNMTCVNCQNKIEKELKHLRGVISASVSYNKGTAEVTYNSDILKLGQIKDSIEKIGYEVKSSEGKDIVAFIKSVGFISLIILLFIILNASGLSNKLAPTKLADSSMGIGMLFVIGLITSVHCVAMCGGINLSQSLKKDSLSPFLPTLYYNLGRVVSYTLCGFIFGSLGYLIGASEELGIPFAVQGILKLIAGVFMVIMGINMLDLFPWLRRLTIRVPRPIARVIAKQKGKTRIPFVVGILNGFMPCGPLQSMWIVALAAGNPFIGAASMFSFAIGTLPLMLGLGSIVSLLGVKFMNKVMKAGGVLVAVLGLAMLSQGLALNGIDFNIKNGGDQV